MGKEESTNHYCIEVSMPRSPRSFSLVLASGGARGYAHAGILRALEAEGLRPEAIVGVSIGAVIGTTYALRRIPDMLGDLLAACDDNGSTGACPILSGFDESAPETASSADE